MARWWRRDDADPAPPQQQSATGATGSTAPPPVQRAAWRDLPPLRPTITATPPVAPRDSFTSSLATSHNPSFLAPLGHVVDPDGPSGHVEGLASPVAPQVISGGPELPVAQRQASTSAGVNQRSVVQRLLAPRMWLSDSAGGAADRAHPDGAVVHADRTAGNSGRGSPAAAGNGAVPDTGHHVHLGA